MINFEEFFRFNMGKGLLTIALTLLIIASYSQVNTHEKTRCNISGKVLDSLTLLPLEYASLTLFRSGKSKPINGTTSDSAGDFTLTNVSPGNYDIVIEFIGFHAITLKNIIVNQNNEIIHIKQILMVRKSHNLPSVQITAPEKLVENKLDKLVFNAEKDITSQTGVATDILKKVPQISVDVDGNVELQGNSNILFLINGKPSTIFGSNITDVLQAIPANQIKSIEVITNPGAKYDAQGTGGIINIILKHNTVQGINGNVSLTTGTLIQNGSININARKGKFGMNAFVNANARLTTTTPSNLHRVSTDTAMKTSAILEQDGTGDFNRNGFQSGIGFDWATDERNSISGAMNYHRFGNMATGFVNQSELVQLNAGGAFADTNSVNKKNSAFNQHSFDPSLNYKHSFKNKEQQLEIGMDGSFAHMLISSGNDQFLQPKDSLIYGTRNNNPDRENEYEMKVDYVQPLGKEINLSAGGKFSGYDINSTANALVWTPYLNSYMYSSSLSNDLNYRQQVYAAYTELNFPIGKILEAKLGGRYERTQVHAFYANAQQKIDNGYNTFIPSIFLLKKISENQTLKLSFTIRINRPDYSDLNPFINASDPKNISTGNPYLKPEIWDRYEASYNNDLGKIGSFMVTLFYRQSNGDIQPFIIYYPSIQIGDTIYSNAAVTTRENIGIEENAGTNLFLNFHPGDKINVRSNIIFFYRHTINQVNPGYNSSSTIYRFNINASYQLTQMFASEFFGSFSSRHHEAQGYYPSFASYSLALRKLLWSKKGSIALTANNIFSKYVNQRTSLYGPGFVVNSLRGVPYRSLGINFTWKFGKLEMRKEKSEDNTIDTSASQQ